RTRRDYGHIAFRVAGTFAYGYEVRRLQRIEAIGKGLKVIDQADGAQLQLSCELTRVNHPRQVGNLAASVSDRSGDSETRGLGRNSLGLYEVGNDLGQAGVLPAGIDLFHHALQAIAFRL